MATWRLVYRGGNPIGVSVPDFEKHITFGFQHVSRYFNIDFQRVYGAVAANIYVITSPIYYNGLMWTDVTGQWARQIYGGNVPAIWIATHRTMGNVDWVRVAFAHELGHWFTGNAHSPSRNDIMHCCNPPMTNWSQADYNRLRTKLSPRAGAPLPWNDVQFWKPTTPVPPPPPPPAPKPVLEHVSFALHSNPQVVLWTYKLSGSVADIKFFNNGKPLQPIEQKGVQPNTHTVGIFPITEQTNKLQMVATNAYGQSNLEVTYIHNIPKPPEPPKPPVIIHNGFKAQPDSDNGVWSFNLSEAADVTIRLNWIEKNFANTPAGDHNLIVSPLVRGANNVKITATNAGGSYAIELQYEHQPETLDEFKWTNPDNRYDVDADGTISILDAYKVLGFLNDNPNLHVDPTKEPGAYYDVNGDKVITREDAEWIINYLNRNKAGAARVESAEEPKLCGAEGMAAFNTLVSLGAISLPQDEPIVP